MNGGTLNVDTKLTTNTDGNNVHVGKDGTLALTKTAIGLTVATSGDSAAVADTFKGVENAGRVLVTGLDGMTVKAATLTGIKNAIVKNADSTGFIDFGKLAVDATTVSGYNATANTLTATDAESLSGMHLDQFKNTTVTGVSGASNTLNGSFGAVQLTDAATQSGAASFAVAAGKQVYLNNSGNLVVDKDGKLADVAVGNGSSFVTTGQNAVVGGVTGTSGSFVVESGSLEAKGDVNVADLTVTGALTVNEKAAVPASGTTAAQPAQKYTVTATNFTVEQGGVLNVLHDVTLNSGSGALAVDGTMNVKGVLSSANNRTINVGSDNSTGVLTVGTLKDATVFADPAWNNGMEAAQVAVKTLDSGAKVEAGRNSIVAVGTTDITKAQAALAQTGLKLGEVTKGSVGVVNAVAYVTAEPTVTAGVTDYNGTTVGGKVLVSGATQAAGSLRSTGDEHLTANRRTVVIGHTGSHGRFSRHISHCIHNTNRALCDFTELQTGLSQSSLSLRDVGRTDGHDGITAGLDLSPTVKRLHCNLGSFHTVVPGRISKNRCILQRPDSQNTSRIVAADIDRAIVSRRQHALHIHRAIDSQSAGARIEGYIVQNVEHTALFNRKVSSGHRVLLSRLSSRRARSRNRSLFIDRKSSGHREIGNIDVTLGFQRSALNNKATGRARDTTNNCILACCHKGRAITDSNIGKLTVLVNNEVAGVVQINLLASSHSKRGGTALSCGISQLNRTETAVQRIGSA